MPPLPNEKFEILDAVRNQAWLRLALSGAPGAGKTATVLRIASGLVGTMIDMGILTGSLARKIGVVDTEHKSASLYQDKSFPDGKRVPPFNVIELGPPYETGRYQGAVQTFVDAGFPVVAIDQMSHAWAGQGGLLEKKDLIAKRENMNSYTAFGEITPEQNRFIEWLLAQEIHLMVTMRAHQRYVLEQYQDKSGHTKSKPKRIGMGPIQREGTEYEFTTVLALDVDGNTASVIKDRTDIFGPPGTQIGQLTEKHGEALARWLYTGVAIDPAQNTATPGQRLDAIVKINCSQFEACRTLPDLEAAVAKASAEIKAFDTGEYLKVKARASIVAAKDKRKGELTVAGAPREPGVATIGPDDVDALERMAQSARVPLADVYQEFGVPRLAMLPQTKLDDAKDWIDAQDVLRNKSVPRSKARA